MDVILRYGIEVKNIRAACFDGAATFSGRLNGVGQKFKNQQPKVCLTHCHMHSINLSVQDAISAIPLIRDFLVLIEDLIHFLRQSPKRLERVKAISESLNCPLPHIRPLCPTRFTVKFKALSQLEKQIGLLIQCLTEIMEDTHDKKATAHANGLLEKFEKFEFFRSEYSESMLIPFRVDRSIEHKCAEKINEHRTKLRAG